MTMLRKSAAAKHEALRHCLTAFLFAVACTCSPVAGGQAELECDDSSPLTKVCTLRGDIRIDVTSGEIMLVSQDPKTQLGAFRIRPHPRKWDEWLMEAKVTELTVQVVAQDDPKAPSLQCTKRNEVPGVVFSAGGYCGGPFHDFNEVFLPVFETTRKYKRDVVLLMSDLKGEWWWRDNPPKKSFVGAMTNHAIRLIGYEKDTYSRPQGVECFHTLTMGLRHSLCMYDENGGFQSRFKSGKLLQEFAPSMRRGLRVPEPGASRVFVPAGAKPLVGIVQRNTTRKFVNYGELLRAAEAEKFAVVPIMFEALLHPEVAEIMASLDALVAVHGAGLSNICLMRPGGAVLQVMPYGEGGSRDVTGMEYKNFAQEMELEYYEWRVPVQDSTILGQYNHTDPAVASPLSVWNSSSKEDAMALYHSQDVAMPPDLLAAFLRQIRTTLNAKAATAAMLESQSTA